MLIARVFFEHPYARDERDDDMFDRGQLKLGDLCRHRPVGDLAAQPPAAVPNVRFFRSSRRKLVLAIKRTRRLRTWRRAS